MANKAMITRRPDKGSTFSKPTYKADRFANSPERLRVDTEQLAIDSATTRAINNTDGGRSWALSYLALKKLLQM
jgi:hypothetical protein